MHHQLPREHNTQSPVIHLNHNGRAGRRSVGSHTRLQTWDLSDSTQQLYPLSYCDPRAASTIYVSLLVDASGAAERHIWDINHGNFIKLIAKYIGAIDRALCVIIWYL